MFVIKFLVVFISINNFGSRRGHYNAINFKFSRSFSSLFLQKMDFFVKLTETFVKVFERLTFRFILAMSSFVKGVFRTTASPILFEPAISRKISKELRNRHFAKNRHFGEESQHWRKNAILAKRRNFGKTSQFRQKIATFAKNRHFCEKSPF